MHSLTRVEKAQSQLVFSLLILALTMRKVSEDTEMASAELPAVQQCTILIDEILEKKDDARRRLMLYRIERARMRIVKRTSDLHAASAMVGAIRLIVSPTYKSKLGTRFDFIRQTLRNNLPSIEGSEVINQEVANKFEKIFREIVLSI